MILRGLFILFGGILLGAAAHILAILLVPVAEPDTIWSRMEAQGEPLSFHQITGLSGRDPLFEESVCHFTMTDAPVSILGELPEDYWALSVFEPGGGTLFTMSDSSAPTGSPDLIVAPEPDASNPTPYTPLNEQVLVLEVPRGIYFATLRVFVPEEEKRLAARSALDDAECVELEPIPVYTPRVYPDGIPYPRPKPPPPSLPVPSG